MQASVIPARRYGTQPCWKNVQFPRRRSRAERNQDTLAIDRSPIIFFTAESRQVSFVTVRHDRRWRRIRDIIQERDSKPHVVMWRKINEPRKGDTFPLRKKEIRTM